MRRQIELALWPQGDMTPGSVWAILDCARDVRIHRELAVSRLDYQCLYSGNIATELKVVAPHMVELGLRYSFTAKLLGQCWGKSWGIFVRINDSTKLRHHLRKILTVQSEDKRRLLFRFYDPRVLGAYLPTCTPDELETVFGPVSAYIAESSDGGAGIDIFDFQDRQLRRRTVALGGE